MKFFEDLGATFGNGAKVVADKTKELSTVASIKAQIGKAEATLGKLYKDLGKAYYEEHKDSTAYGEQVSEVSAVIAKIEALNMKLTATQGGKLCGTCGEVIDKGSAFCPKCGAKAEDAVEIAVDDTVAVEENTEE